MRLSSRPSKEKVMENGVLFTRIGVSGESTSSAVFRHLYQLPRLRPCGQRRARSGRLGSHGHRAPSLPSVRMAASGLAASETFHWTTNQLTHKGLEQEKVQGLWFSAFGALTPVLCFLALTRGFERICAASSDKRTAHDTHASASCEEKRSRRDRRYDNKRQDDVPAVVDGAWHIVLLCQMLVCGVHVLEGIETREDVFKENAHWCQVRDQGGQ